MWFKDDRIFVDSDFRRGRPSTAITPDNIKQVRLLIENDRQLSLRNFENDLGIPKYCS